jgi:ribA/ribD-fused uncharacterized protein
MNLDIVATCEYDGGEVVTLTWKEGRQTVHSPGSNFWISENGFCVEKEFQAQKHRGHPFRQAMIRNAKTPAKAKWLGRKWKLTDEELFMWESCKLDLLLNLLRYKLQTSDKFRNWLLATDRMPIVEINWWHDNYYGDCVCDQRPKCRQRGENILGRALEQIRLELVESIPIGRRSDLVGQAILR